MLGLKLDHVSNRGHSSKNSYHMALDQNNVSIEFEIWSKFAVLWFKMCSTGHNKILHTSRQCFCHDVQNFIVIGQICYEQEYYKI